MANKFRPGIPDNFQFNVTPVADLGDYLDEPGPSPVIPKRVKESIASVAVAPVQIRKIAESLPAAVPPRVATEAIVANTVDRGVGESPPPRTSLPAPPIPSEPMPLSESRAPRHTGPRREINMSPEALRMSEELLDLIRSGSGQRDTKANELIHALLLLAHEVRDELDPHSLPKRGRWGTPTARAYPLEIKNALLQALRRKYIGA